MSAVQRLAGGNGGIDVRTRTRSASVSFFSLLGVLIAAGAAAQSAGPIDDQALKSARADGEWLTHGGDYAETRFSTLAAIDRGNVAELALAWSVEVGSEGGRQESTPLVANGVLYATTTWNVVFAIDLGTQSIKWRWDPGVARGIANGGARFCCGSVNRGLALYDGKVYM